MNCDDVKRNLIDFIENACTEQTMEQIDNHREFCVACSNMINEFKILWNTDRVADPIPFDEFYQQITDKLYKRQRRSVVGFVLTPRCMQPILTSLLIGMAIWFGIYLGNSYFLQDVFNRNENSELIFSSLTSVPIYSLEDFYISDIVQGK